MPTRIQKAKQVRLHNAVKKASEAFDRNRDKKKEKTLAAKWKNALDAESNYNEQVRESDIRASHAYHDKMIRANRRK